MKFIKLLSMALVLLFSTIAHAQAWEYRNKTDQMRGTSTRFAESTSTNKVNFGAPYAGGSYLELTLRERSKDGLNILFTISKGQFQCPSGCKFFAKFDEGKIYEIGLFIINGGQRYLLNLFLRRNIFNRGHTDVPSRFYPRSTWFSRPTRGSQAGDPCLG